MPKPMYVWSGSAWVSVATEVESLATYATQSYASAQPAMKMVVPTSVAVGSGTGAVDTNGAITFSGASSVSLNGCFTSVYDNYKILLSITASTAAETRWRGRTSGTDNTTSNYNTVYTEQGASYGGGKITSVDYARIGYHETEQSSWCVETFNPFLSKTTQIDSPQIRNTGTNIYKQAYVSAFNSTTSFDGITFYPSSGTITGTMRVYGYKN